MLPDGLSLADTWDAIDMLVEGAIHGSIQALLRGNSFVRELGITEFCEGTK